MVTFCSRKNARLLQSKLQFGTDILDIKESINILGAVFDYKLSFNQHLEAVAGKASTRVTLMKAC